MGLLDGLLGGDGGNGLIDSIAGKFGIDPETARNAIGSLTAAHAQPSDTVETAASQSGIDPAILSQIAEHIGGEGALGQLAQQAASNPEVLSGIMGAASAFFGRKD